MLLGFLARVPVSLRAAAAIALMSCSSQSPSPEEHGGTGGGNGSAGSAGASGVSGGTSGAGGASNGGASGAGGSVAGQSQAGLGGTSAGASGQGGSSAGGVSTSGSSGSGGQVAQAGAGAGGQAAAAGAGAGGLETTGGASGATSMSGAGGAAAGTGGDGGAAAGTGGNGGAAGGGSDCSSLPLCDSFESTAVGSPPSSTLWTLVPSSAAGMATVDSMGAHGSSRSLKVVSPDRLYLRNSSVIGTLGNVIHVRFYVRFASTLATGHGAMIVTHPTMVDQYSQSNELRFGSQDQVYHWNTDSDAANIPDVSPNGDAASVKPAANTWYCIELTLNTNGNLSASIDGMEIPGLVADGMGTANIDQAWVNSSASLSRYTAFADFSFGWQSYGGGALTLWYDDVALSASPIGCE